MLNKTEEKQLFSIPRIYVDNNALAFFDVENPSERITNIQEIKGNPVKSNWNQDYNFSVLKEQTHYFRTKRQSGSLSTVSVTGPCIVFCAFTMGKTGRPKSSGIYHAYSLPPSERFESRLKRLIDEVRKRPYEKVIVKAAGGNGYTKETQETERDISILLDERDAVMDPKYFLLGHGRIRVTEFYPMTGQLITWPDRKSDKKIVL